MSDELPEGWAITDIRTLFDCWGGMTPSTSRSDFWDGKVPWLSSRDIKMARILDSSEHITAKALAETRLRKCRPGVVLVVVVLSGVLAHTLPVSILATEAVVNQDLKVFDSGDDLLNEWLAWFLRGCERQILSTNRKEGDNGPEHQGRRAAASSSAPRAPPRAAPNRGEGRDPAGACERGARAAGEGTVAS